MKVKMYSLIQIWTTLLLVGAFMEMTGGAEEGRVVKRVRASLGGGADVAREPAQELDVASEEPPPPERAPIAFIAPSVKEYLELGMAIPGKPGTDYPVLGAVPYTNFYCDEQSYPGFFADMDTRCQAWHYCDIDGRQASFLCPNGTIFSQAVASCDWWFNVECSVSGKLYALNARLYRRRDKSTKPKPHRTIDRQLLEDIFQ